MDENEIIEESSEIQDEYEETTTPEEKPVKKSLKQKLKETDQKNGSVWQAIKYFLCAASAGLIQFVTFTIMKTAFDKTGVTESMGTMWFFQDINKTTFIATTIALGLSVLWNFTLNRKFTFKAANNVPLAMGLAFLFYVPFYPFQTWYVGAVENAINNSVGYEASWGAIIAEGTVMLINGILEFCWQKFVVFRNSGKTEEKTEEVTIEEAPVEEPQETEEIVEDNKTEK